MGINTNHKGVVMIDYTNTDKRFFKTIDTKQKAYWLGFIAADGYVNNKRLTIRLSPKDQERIDLFIEHINAPSEAKKFDSQGYVYVNIYGKDLVSDLNKQGIKTPKAHYVTFNDLGSYKLNLAFLQGYYDGDGNAKGAGICSCSLKILEQFKSYFNIPFDIKEHKGVYYLNIGMNLKREMNENMTNSMPRKRAPSIKMPKIHRKFEVTKEELEQLIKNDTWVSIARRFGVSDTSIRKRAKRLGVMGT